MMNRFGWRPMAAMALVVSLAATGIGVASQAGEVNKVYSSSSKVSRQLPSQAYEAGMKAYRAGQYDAAIQSFEAALAQSPTDPNLTYCLANALARRWRYDEAKVYYHKTATLAPHSTAATLSLIAIDKIDRYNAKYGAFQKLTPETLSKNNNNLASLDEAALLKSMKNNGEPGAVSLALQDGYLNLVAEDGGLTYWAPKNMPLKLYVPRDGLGADVHELAPKAMDAWVRASGGRIRYVLVETPQQANIRVTWTGFIGIQKEADSVYLRKGTTQMKLAKEGVVFQDIHVAVVDLNHHPEKKTKLYHTLVHEFGHALGLRGHSDNPRDVMYFAEQEGVTGRLTQRDINTIQQLYSPDLMRQIASQGR